MNGVDYGITEGQVLDGPGEDATYLCLESPEWFRSEVAKYYPDFKQGHEHYVREQQEFGSLVSEEEMGSIWTDFRDTLVSSSEKQAVELAQTLIQQGGTQVSNLITGEKVQAPPGYTVVGFDKNGNPIFAPLSAASGNVVSTSDFMKKYGFYIYGALGVTALILILMLILPSRGSHEK